MSTTTNREVALFYATGGAAQFADPSVLHKPSMVFCTQMGMVSRGADISWLSQFVRSRCDSNSVTGLLVVISRCDRVARWAASRKRDVISSPDRDGGPGLNGRGARPGLRHRTICEHGVPHH